MAKDYYVSLDTENTYGEESCKDGLLRPLGSPTTPEVGRQSVYLVSLRVTKDVLLLLTSLIAIVACWRAPSLEGGKSPTTPCDCGNSVAEAKAMGCVYDDLAPAWLPQHCMDHELKAVFDKAGDGPGGRWQYFADANLTQRLTVDEVALFADSPEKYFYSTPRWHLMHCNYYWRKMFRSHLNGVQIEGRYNSERHVKHCGEVFETYPEPLTFSYVALKSSSPDPPDFEIRRLKEAGIDPFEFRIDGHR
ncbi:hypothetical protein EsDP_00005981 [Epichloe bromicola]|uniref:Uncharacterized protein n=1 Tax=Epichloe bromicola TaxID=79588 RepID=A0ABQ0CWA4_9HYPO